MTNWYYTYNFYAFLMIFLTGKENRSLWERNIYKIEEEKDEKEKWYESSGSC